MTKEANPFAALAALASMRPRLIAVDDYGYFGTPAELHHRFNEATADRRG